MYVFLTKSNDSPLNYNKSLAIERRVRNTVCVAAIPFPIPLLPLLGSWGETLSSFGEKIIQMWLPGAAAGTSRAFLSSFSPNTTIWGHAPRRYWPLKPQIQAALFLICYFLVCGEYAAACSLNAALGMKRAQGLLCSPAASLCLAAQEVTMHSIVFSEMLQFGVRLPWSRQWGCWKQELGKKRLYMLRMHKVENGSRAGGGRHKTPCEFSRGMQPLCPVCLCMVVTYHSRAVLWAVHGQWCT